ncbi:YhdT family protein [Stieleria sp. TO1_6]|uniref:DUF997 family protein n=1 Tax=Stieleria tagensis TaxID=2956795 RepID=UPI00209A9002|nr:DUF997 family protein [Stieleria tagensis]MCO8124035.1 YhdT family protein [Stieleria tagensis]
MNVVDGTATPNEPDPPVGGSSKSLLDHCRHEMVWMAALWTVLLVWVVGCCWSIGYTPPGQVTPLVWGMPAWALWGVFLPWLVATVATIWFVLFRMIDDPLGEHVAAENGAEPDEESDASAG